MRANAAFYAAFGAGDFEAMERLWAQSVEVACLHPGAPRIHGRDPVLHSWKQILREAGRWDISCRDPAVQITGPSAYVTCLEATGDDPAHLVATNIYVLEDEQWRIALHQAGPLVTAPQRRPDPRTLN